MRLGFRAVNPATTSAFAAFCSTSGVALRKLDPVSLKHGSCIIQVAGSESTVSNARFVGIHNSTHHTLLMARRAEATAAQSHSSAVSSAVSRSRAVRAKLASTMGLASARQMQSFSTGCTTGICCWYDEGNEGSFQAAGAECNLPTWRRVQQHVAQRRQRLAPHPAVLFLQRHLQQAGTSHARVTLGSLGTIIHVHVQAGVICNIATDPMGDRKERASQ